MSWRYAPLALAMNGGSPPTAPNARAGLLTPPGITRLARAKAWWLCGRRKPGLERAGERSIVGGAKRRAFAMPSGSIKQLFPARDVGRPLRQFFDLIHVRHCLDHRLELRGRRSEVLSTQPEKHPPCFRGFSLKKDRRVCAGFTHITLS